MFSLPSSGPTIKDFVTAICGIIAGLFLFLILKVLDRLMVGYSFQRSTNQYYRATPDHILMVKEGPLYKVKNESK